MNRRRSRQVNIGGVTVGGDAPVRVQSMTITKTFDVAATLAQIESLAAAGCELVRVVRARAHELPDGMKVAVMGCPVNGSGESRGADVGIAAGVHQGLLFVGGESVARYREDELVDALVVAAPEYHGRRSEGGEAS